IAAVARHAHGVRGVRGRAPLWVLAFGLLAAGCTPIGRGGFSGTSYDSGTASGPVQASAQEAIRTAQDILAHQPDRQIDCSHFVLACYHSARMADYFRRQKPGENLTYYLNEYLTQARTRRAHAADIEPGDILIFNETYDLNHDGRIDGQDVYTHTGIVESFQDWVVTYLDASLGRHPDIQRRRFSFYGDRYNETVARDPATGRAIHARETFYAAYAVPP
ncbi:MAG TPA: hypothetical protein VFR02_01595, partial [bacterium]|nr:hypothetical protein [bacterium]